MAGEKRGIDLSAFPSDDDSSDGDAPTEQRPPLAKDSASFGAAYLAQFGWKKGQPIRPGGVTEEYKPRSEGGFASAGQAKVDTTRLVTGAAVARVQATGGGAPAVGTITRTDGVSAEVEFADGTRGVVPIAQLRLASPVEATTMQRAKRERDTAAGPSTADDSDASRWVMPRLVVRVVEPASRDGDASFEPYKATVVKVDRGPGGGRVLLSNGTVVSGNQLDTVLPKKGERGIIVLGPHRGKLATVAAKPKNADVQVSLPDGVSCELPPEHLCSLDSGGK